MGKEIEILHVVRVGKMERRHVGIYVRIERGTRGDLFYRPRDVQHHATISRSCREGRRTKAGDACFSCRLTDAVTAFREAEKEDDALVLTVPSGT